MISPTQRPEPVNTQHSQQTTIHVPGDIRTLNPSKRAKRPKNHALDRAANGIGFQSIYVLVNFLYVSAWKSTWAIKGLSRCWRLGPSGLCHRVVLVVNRSFKETYSLEFRVPLPLTLIMEATIYSVQGGIHLQDNQLVKTQNTAVLTLSIVKSWTFMSVKTARNLVKIRIWNIPNASR